MSETQQQQEPQESATASASAALSSSLEDPEASRMTTATNATLGTTGTNSPSKQFKRKQLTRRLSNLPAKGLETDRFSLRIPADFDAAHTAAETHGHDHWKVKLLHFVHSPPVQHTLMILLFTDVIILFLELFLQASYPPCYIIVRDAISCCPVKEVVVTTITEAMNAAAAANNSSGYHGEDDHHRYLAEEAHHGDSHSSSSTSDAHHGDDHHEPICQYPSVESHAYEAGCDKHKWHLVHTVEAVMFYFTIGILSTFFLELMVVMMVLQKAFFRQLFYVLDLFIVTVSLAFEITFAVVHQQLLLTFTGLLILGRAWRFVRIGHGLVELTAEYQAQEKEALLHYAEQLEEILTKNNLELPVKSKELKRIVNTLTHHDEMEAVGGGGHHHHNSHNNDNQNDNDNNKSHHDDGDPEATDPVQVESSLET